MKRNSWWRLSPLNIALFYVLIGILWVLLPGQVFSTLFGKPMLYQRIEVLNHCLFIIVTAWILYFLIRQSERAIRLSSNACAPDWKAQKSSGLVYSVQMETM